MNALITWFVKNPVASNLIMLFVIVGGLVGINTVGKTVFPSGVIDTIQIAVPYLGANPGDVEERILIPIEEAISGLKGIKRIQSNGFEGRGTVTIDAIEGYDVEVLLNEVKARVDAINTFPARSERPVVRRFFANVPVSFYLISGNIPERELKELGRDIRDQIAAIPGAENTSLQWTKEYEISIEVSEFQLEKYGLTFDDIALAIRRSSLNVGAGMIDDITGETQLTTRGQAYVKEDFERIVVLQQEDGNQLYLMDVANIVDGFTDVEVITRYKNMPTLLIQILASENPDVVTLSEEVERLLDEKIRPDLPEGVEVDLLIDYSDVFKDRLSLLLNNGLMGLVLVFLALTLFLTPRLAFWVCAGICISFLGCFWLLPYFGIPLSMISTFALVLILGIVVDDAVIISESIYRKNQQGMLGQEASIAGASMVARPVIFSALTTMLAFSPLLFILGATRAFVIAIPIVVILTLFFSLLESFCILPMHLVAKEAKQNRWSNNVLLRFLTRIRAKADAGLQYFIYEVYRPFLDKVLRRKVLSLMSFIAVCFFIVSFAIGGWVKFTFNPNIVGDFVQVSMEFPAGIPMSIKEDALNKLEASSVQLRESLKVDYPGKDLIKGTVFWTFTGSTQVGAYLMFEESELNSINPDDIARRWRELVPDIPEAKQLTFQFTLNDNDPSLMVVLESNDSVLLKRASADLEEKLAAYPGVYEVSDSTESASSEAVLSLLPGAENLGISLNNLATQVRQAFYGEEVQRIPRGKDTVRVMVRLPKKDRQSFNTLNDLRIRTANGDAVPFEMVANVTYRPGVSQINRTDRVKVIWLIAKVDETEGNLSEIAEDLNNNFFEEFANTHPGIGIRWAGGQEGQSEFLDSLSRNTMFALFAIFFILAVAFKSYSQPLIIMTAIPCGYVGAIIGHLVLGLDLSIYSIFGIVAAAGVVINDNLVLMDYINRLRAKGFNAIRAVERAAEERFRPIFLTSFTTFVGLLPMMFETSIQAQFMIPTVVSLAFGVLFATTVTLLLVPVLYLMLADFEVWVRKLFTGNSEAVETLQ